MCGVAIARAASSFSLLLLLVAAWGSDLQTLANRLREAEEPEQRAKILRETDLKKLDPELGRQLEAATRSREARQQRLIQELSEQIILRAEVEAVPLVDPAQAAQQARDIKASPLYRDPGVRTTGNWIARAFENIRLRMPQFGRMPDIEAPVGLGAWLIPLMWGLLAIALAFLIWFAVRHFAWKRKLARKARALLDEDEPERTVDEWLALADDLESQGRYREAIRCLYLASLLRFDEHNVARFERGQTNWEHLARINASPRKPQSIDFSKPTAEFDAIWYGGRPHGQSEVWRFREWYSAITAQLSKEAA
jgi:hypothetical protein